MISRCKALFAGYWLVTFALFGVGLYLVAYQTPNEQSMGVVQKIFYLHLPTAINTFVACLVVFIASVGYLWQRTTQWDDLAHAAAKVAVLLCSVVLLTGMIWGKVAWGAWWQWTPRLTFSLVLWLLYVVYLMLRATIDSGQRRAVVAAVYGVIAFLDVPLVYLSVKLLKDIHPSSIALAPEMKRTLLFWFLPVTLFTIGMIAGGYRMLRLQAQARAQDEESAIQTAGGAL